jgi:hypothetical protein
MVRARGWHDDTERARAMTRGDKLGRCKVPRGRH